jgi:hypothetical protein
MANKFNGLLDSIANGALNPKGNLADFQHAARLFTDTNHALAPKTKFLFHVFFDVNATAAGINQNIDARKVNEMGMLVKSADLPQYQANVETKKKYNRVKNVQTSIVYQPVRVTFHDDNSSLTSMLMQAYYRYHYADGNQDRNSGKAYARTPDSTYEGAERNKEKFGLDNNTTVPFFNNIQISQLSRGAYVTYTLVNPIITQWGHDRLDNSDGQGTMENFMEIAYEAVFYTAGKVEGGANGEPNGFAQDHYDNMPSPNSLQGGGGGGLGAILNGAIDLYDFISGGDTFNNPLEAALVAANLIGNFKNLSSEGLRQEGFNILTGAIGRTAGINVSGVSQTLFPKSGGNGGEGKTLLATAGVALALGAVNNYSKNQQLRNDPAALESAARQEFSKKWQNEGKVGGVNSRNSAYDALQTDEKQVYKDKALGES